MNRIHRARGMARCALGFTLTELLIVMLIIVILISLLLPVISKVRNASYQASTQQDIDRIAAAVQEYYSDFNAYPGVFKNDDIGTTNMLVANNGAQIANIPDCTKITETESMELSLLGGLIWSSATPAVLTFDYGTLRASKGPIQLASSTTYKQYPAYLIAGNNDLLTTDASGNLMATTGGIPSGLWNAASTPTSQGVPYSTTTADSPVPEFADGFINQPMPIVYLRAKTGMLLPFDGPAAGTPSQAQYNYTHLYPYFLQSGVVNGTSTTLPYIYSTPGWPGYFNNTTAPPINGNMQPRNANGFWLISAGLDRIYGTSDDICYGFSF